VAAGSKGFSAWARWAHCSRIARQDCNKDMSFFRCVVYFMLEPLIEGCNM
jgi:hypothetical protein